MQLTPGHAIYLAFGLSNLDGKTSSGGEPREIPEHTGSIYAIWQSSDDAGYSVGVTTQGDSVIGNNKPEMGAPWTLALKAQAESGPQQFKAIIDVLKNYSFEEMIGSTCVAKEAIGVCAMITPWNWPISQIALKVAPALAAGCTMILKPSEIAPFNAMLSVSLSLTA